jgi:hypothetical protein
MEQCCGRLAVEIVPGNIAISAPILPRERELSLAHAQRCSFLIMEQRFVSLAIKFFKESTAISEPTLPRVRELTLSYAHRCSLIMGQCYVPLSVELVQGKH